MLTKDTTPLHNAVHPPSWRDIDWQRKQVSQTLRGEIAGLIVGVGQCSTNVRDIDITRSESADNRRFMADRRGVLLAQRLNHWKPRSPRSDGIKPWEGMETTHKAEAMQLTEETTSSGSPVCMELALPHHVIYVPHLAFGWFGSRNRDDRFTLNLAAKHPDLPLLGKNDLDGDMTWARRFVKTARHIRSHMSRAAVVATLHRGGSELHTPELWEQSVLRELELTEGQMMLDLAHGAEQAHEPNGNYDVKSVEGQERALEHYIEIGERTGMWARGLLIEASDAPSDTDPNMPRQKALDGIVHILSLMGLPAPQIEPSSEFGDKWDY